MLAMPLIKVLGTGLDLSVGVPVFWNHTVRPQALKFQSLPRLLWINY